MNNSRRVNEKRLSAAQLFPSPPTASWLVVSWPRGRQGDRGEESVDGGGKHVEVGEGRDGAPFSQDPLLLFSACQPCRCQQRTVIIVWKSISVKAPSSRLSRNCTICRSGRTRIDTIYRSDWTKTVHFGDLAEFVLFSGTINDNDILSTTTMTIMMMNFISFIVTHADDNDLWLLLTCCSCSSPLCFSFQTFRSRT